MSLIVIQQAWDLKSKVTWLYNHFVGTRGPFRSDLTCIGQGIGFPELN